MSAFLPHLRLLRRFVWASCCLLLLPAFAPPLEGATAVILDAWWTNQRDADSDGCFAGVGPGETARLNWDPNVSGGTGSLTVFEKVYYRPCGFTTWTLFTVTAAHVITGTNVADRQFLDVPLDPGCACYDYRIEVFRSGVGTPDDARDRNNDADLANHFEEALAQDVSTPLVTIANAWWSNQRDADGDGCVAGATGEVARLNWDPNVVSGSGSMTVFEALYYKECTAGSWSLFGTTVTHVITGTNLSDAVSAGIPMDPDCNCFDYMIEIYRVGQTVADYTRHPGNDSDLAFHREELSTQDTPKATIRDASWTNQQDADGDGCVSGTGAGGTARLNFIPDVVGNATLNVFEKVFYRPCAGGTWTLYQTGPSHSVTGSNSPVVQALDIVMDPGCACFDYRIEIFRSGMTTPDAFRDSSNDADLALHREESVAQDTPLIATAAIVDAWWTNQRDADGDGCVAGTGAGGTARLNWDPNVVGTNGSLRVFEQIFFKSCASNVWFLYATNAAHTITNNDASDHQFVDVIMDPGCQCFDYLIVIFRMGVATEDDSRGPGVDADLSQHREEDLSSDLTARIRIEPLALSVSCDAAAPRALPAGVRAPKAGVSEAVSAPLKPRPSGIKPAWTTVSSQFEPHVITVKFRDGLMIRARDGQLTDLGTGMLDAAKTVLGGLNGAQWQSAHGLPEAKIEELRQNAQRRLRREIADLNLQMNLFLPAGSDPGAVIDSLNALDIVELAQPVPRPAPLPFPPDFSPLQAYLGIAPEGIDAVNARSSFGASGAGIRIADVEYSFNPQHQDLPPVTLVGYPPNAPAPASQDYIDHGTAVLGELGALDNGWGVTGIAPQSSFYFSGTLSGGVLRVGDAVLYAAAVLSPGDVIVIEQQTFGPNYPCSSSEQCGLVPVEWYRPWYDDIVTAVGNGIVVVEAGGNGEQNLDDPVYRTGNGGHWPFLPENNSGAILVGAGAAPPAYGGSQNARSRLDFSNYGGRLDLQGWGESVWTAGYGSLLESTNWDEPGVNLDFTGGFGGTSSAAPIVAGACALLQSAFKARASNLLSTEELKQILRATGSPQQPGEFPVTENIGPMPNVPSAIRTIVPPPAGGSFRIHNDGVGPLLVNSIAPDSPASWIDLNPKPPFSVPPGTYFTVSVAVDCTRASVGQSTRRLLVSSSDPDPSHNPYPDGVWITLNNPVPALHIDRTWSHITISWNPAAPGLVLQSAMSLAPSDWSDVPGGTNNPVTLSTTNTAQFYRLRGP